MKDETFSRHSLPSVCGLVLCLDQSSKAELEEAHTNPFLILEIANMLKAPGKP